MHSLLNDTPSTRQFQHHVNQATETLSDLIIDKWADFNLNWKKMITYYLLCSVSYQRYGKNKNALNCIHAAQKISTIYKTDQEDPRSLDYTLAANTFTAFMLLKIGKLPEAHDFILISEKILNKVIAYSLHDEAPPKRQAYQR
jgi:hypothetical protein